MEQDEAFGGTETSLEEELKSSVLLEDGMKSMQKRDGNQQQESMKPFFREGKLGRPATGSILSTIGR